MVKMTHFMCILLIPNFFLNDIRWKGVGWCPQLNRESAGFPWLPHSFASSLRTGKGVPSLSLGALPERDNDFLKRAAAPWESGLVTSIIRLRFFLRVEVPRMDEVVPPPSDQELSQWVRVEWRKVGFLFEIIVSPAQSRGSEALQAPIARHSQAHLQPVGSKFWELS